MRALLVLSWLLVLMAPVLAQPEPEKSFLTQMDALLRQGNIEAMAQLVQAQPEVAKSSFVLLVKVLPTAEPDDQKLAGALLNVIARTFELRLGDPQYSAFLTKNGIAADAKVWQGTALADKAAVQAPGATNEQALLKLALSVGNFMDAFKLAEKAKQYRVIAACALGMGRPTEALGIAERLLATKLSPPEEYATRLLATHAAYIGALGGRFQDHLKKLEALPLPAGPYGQVAAYLLETYRLDRDLTLDTDMPVAEILTRHDRAWGHLNGLGSASKESLEPFTSELFWIGESYWRTWFKGVGVIKTAGDPEHPDPRLKEVGPKLMGDLTTILQTGAALQKATHFELYFTGINLLESYTRMGQGPEPKQVTDSATLIGKLDGFITPLYKGCQDLAQSLGPNVPVSTTRGSVSNLMANLYLLKANQILQETKLTPSDEQAARFRQLLTEAGPFVKEAYNVDTSIDYLLLDLEYLLGSQPAGWEAAYEDRLKQFQAVTGGLQTRQAQFFHASYLGKLRNQQNRKAEAAAEFRKAVEAMEVSLREFGGNAKLMQVNRAVNREIYEALAKAQIQQGQNADAFQTVGRLQQLESAGTFNLGDLQPRVKPADQPLVLRAQQGQQQLEAQEQELASLKVSGADPAKIQKASQLLADSRKSYFETVTALEKKYPEFEKLDVRPINFAKLQRSIPKDTLVVLLFPTADEMFLMEATSENLSVRKVALKRKELNALVGAYRSELLKNKEASRETSGKLYSALIAPLEADLQAKDTLAIIPYGSLMYLPFGALAPVGAGEPQYLISKKRISVLCKATDLDQVFGPPSGKTGALVAFGNPDGSLPASGQEATAVGGLFPGAKVYLEGQATSDKLSTVQAPAVSYLHLATHGVLDSRDPRGSYLTMAQGQKLSVTDITGTRLDGPNGDLNLVTLSACQTALADRDPDGSDLRSLADAFSFAGCRSMVASLWSVDDGSTQVLMTEFYKNLKAGQGKAQALQTAQMALIKDPKYGKPFYWAPFVLIGDWR